MRDEGPDGPESPAGKRVLVTGISSGIGLALARRLSAAGCRVVGTASNPEKTREKWKSRGQFSSLPFHLVGMDLADPAAVETGFAAAREILGGVDILVNNAGTGELGAVEDTPLEDARRLFEVNYFGPVTLIKKVLPEMRARGAGILVNLGSIVSDLQFPFKAQYCASKSALTAFSISLRHEVAPYGIRVHLIEPGWVRTEFHNRLAPVFRPETPYGDRLRPFLDFSSDRDPRLPDGEAVAALIERVIENPRAPVRLRPGRQAKGFRLLRHVLTDAMLDRLVRYKLGKKGG